MQEWISEYLRVSERGGRHRIGWFFSLGTVILIFSQRAHLHEALHRCYAVVLLFLLQQQSVARLKKLPRLKKELLKRVVQMQKEKPNPMIKTILTSQNSKGNLKNGSV